MGARDHAWGRLLCFVAKVNASPLHRDAFQGRRTCSGGQTNTGAPKIYLADLMGVDELVHVSDVSARMAQSEQRSRALGQPGVWAFAEHKHAALPDHDGLDIRASLWCADGAEMRFLDDASRHDAWVSHGDEPVECEYPELGVEHDALPPVSVRDAFAGGAASGTRCVPTLATGSRRHVTTETRFVIV